MGFAKKLVKGLSKPGAPTSTSSGFSRSSSRQRLGDDQITRSVGGNLLRELTKARGTERLEAGLRREGLTGLATAGEAGGLTQAGTDQLLETIAGRGGGDIAGRLEAISSPAIRNLKRSILPSISSAFAGDAGTGSGLETAAISDATEGVAGQIAAQAAQLQEAERGRQFGAAQLFPQIAESQARVGGAQVAGGDAGFNRISDIASLIPALRVSESQSVSNQSSEGGRGPGKGGALGNLVGAGVGTIFGPAGTIIGERLGGSVSNSLFGGGQAG